MPSTASSSARPRISRILGGCTSVSIVSATIGFSRRAGSLGAFFVVHMMICEPFQVNAIGTLRGVPSLATYASRVRSRASSSRLIGRFRISVISFGFMVISPVVVLVSSGGSQAAATGPSADLLGQGDDDAFGATEVAEPVAVLVLRHLAHEFGAVGAQPGDDVVDVVDREHDAANAQRVRRGVLRHAS